MSIIFKKICELLDPYLRYDFKILRKSGVKIYKQHVGWKKYTRIPAEVIPEDENYVEFYKVDKLTEDEKSSVYERLKAGKITQQQYKEQNKYLISKVNLRG